MAVRYVPDAGDVVWLDFDPQLGHEQGGHRPAVVLSPVSYNRVSGLMIACPTTTKIKGYPFEVSIGGEPPSVVLADQIRCLDWRARRVARKTHVAEGELAELRAKLAALLGIGR